MLPKELASVSSDGRKGWLVTSHFDWLCRQINKQQRHTRCFVMDPCLRGEAVAKLFSTTTREEVKRIIFIMSVGRQDDGKVFFGTDNMQGDHWSVAVVNVLTQKINYCDTLGWPAPAKFMSAVLTYTRFVGIYHANAMKIHMAHQPNEEIHECTNSCTNYPLQTCSDICGVIAMVIVAVATLDNKLFNLLLTPVKDRINVYLLFPTDYSSYLRRVIITWLSCCHVDIKKISLKSDFDPHSSSEDTENKLKRRLDLLDCINGPPAKVFKIDDKSVNDFLKDNIHKLKDSPKQIIKDIVHNFSRTKAVQDVKNKLKTFFEQFVFNGNLERDQDDGLSTRSYVMEFANFPDETNPIILYKAEGKASPLMDRQDLAIGIQTKFQREIMQLYGRKSVCVEIHRKAQDQKLHVITLSVVYEGTHEVPCSWLITNRDDILVYRAFFEAIKSKIGDLVTEVFIGDMAFNFYRAWIKVFTKPSKRMFASWEVIRVLNNRMGNFIEDAKLLEEARQIISVLPSIIDVDLFKKYASAVLSCLRPISEEAYDYLRSKFVEDGKDLYWASCHRLRTGDSYIPFLSPFNTTLDVVDFCGNDRMDRYVHQFLQLIKYYELQLEIGTSESKLRRACAEISMKHNQPVFGLDIFQSATGDEWLIRTTESNNSCHVMKTGLDDSKCTVRCEHCKISLYHYVCTCVQYLLISGGCCHIHFVHSYQKMNAAVGVSAVKDTSNDDEIKEDIKDEIKEENLSQNNGHAEDREGSSTLVNGHAVNDDEIKNEIKDEIKEEPV